MCGLPKNVNIVKINDAANIGRDLRVLGGLHEAIQEVEVSKGEENAALTKIKIKGLNANNISQKHIKYDLFNINNDIGVHFYGLALLYVDSEKGIEVQPIITNMRMREYH